MEPFIIAKKSFTVVGYEIRTSNNNGANFREIPEFWNQYIQNKWDDSISGKKVPSVEYGICSDINAQTKEFSYLIGCETETLTQKPDNMVLKNIPASKYAVFTTPKVRYSNFSSSIQEMIVCIYRQWLPASSFIYNYDGLTIEAYNHRSSMINELLQMDIWIPVKEVHN